MLNTFLRNAGLAFENEAEEHGFLGFFILSHKKIIEIFVLLGAFLLYSFFLFDKLIDPIQGERAQYIRLTSSLIVLCGFFLLKVKSFDSYIESILIGLGLISIVGLLIIYSFLQSGYLVETGGLVLVLMYFYCAIPLRVTYCFLLGFITLVFTAIAAIISGFPVGIIVANSMSVACAAIVGTVSAYYREVDARKRFALSRDLKSASFEVEDIERAHKLLLGQSTGNVVFISYRRGASSAIAGRIRDRLVSFFGAESVFFDIDNIPFGVDFRAHIRKSIVRADTFLVLIGDGWFGEDGGSPRISDPNDPVRLEIEIAFECGKRIIPVLLNRWAMPLEKSLPASINQLVYLNAADIESGRNFHIEVDRLIRAIVKP